MIIAGGDTLVSCLAKTPRGINGFIGTHSGTDGAVEVPKANAPAFGAVTEANAPTYGFRFRGLDAGERYYPFEALEQEAHRRAGKLQQLDLQPNDRVALVVADPAEFVLSFLAASVAGAVPVPIYPRASFKAKNAYVETVSHIVATSGAKLLLTMESTLPVLEEVLTLHPNLVRIVTVESLSQMPERSPQLPLVRPDDICFLQFTSGSTSLPKGVMVTHRNLIANARAFLGPHGVNATLDDLTVTWLPLYHDMGLIGFVLGTIVCAVPTLIMPTEAFGRRPNIWLETLHRAGGTLTFAPNFAYALATKRARDRDVEGLDLSRVRVAGCGAEPINAKVMRDFVARFSACGFSPNALLPAYGMAEATLAITFHPRQTPVVTDRVSLKAMQTGHATPVSDAEAESGAATQELVSCGIPFPEHEVLIMDEQSQPLPERRVGEVVTRGPSITGGYYKNPEATAESWRDGFLHTGDLGYFADGRLYICGRMKDLIIIRGANYYPQDIEWSVAELEGVRRDNVVAFSVMRGGEEQLVVCAEANSAEAESLRKGIAAKVAETVAITVGHVAIVRVGSLPKTSSGKVQRRRTKAMFESGELEEHLTKEPTSSVGQ